MLRVLHFGLLILIAVAAAACGGGAGAPIPEQSPGEPSTIAEESMPGLDGLPVPERGVSITGPGWYGIDPYDPFMRVAESGNVAADGGVHLDSSSGPAFAIFGIRGFDGDCYPTSARITINLLSGSYYVGFSDYVSGAWQFAGPFYGNATAEAPYVGEYSSANAYVSEDGVSYLMVLAHNGVEIGLEHVELGVHGGSDAPEPPGFITLLGFSTAGGPAGTLLNWMHSPSRNNPDFAGYYIERAPEMIGDFTRLNAEPVPTPYFLDETPELEQIYRYRVCAADVSGNLSTYISMPGRATAAGDTNPVLDLRLPRGKLHGPVAVTFDMSGSYDPDGAGITNYVLDLGYRAPSYSGPNNTVDLMLEPGCYRILCLATSPSGTTTTMEYLKVYPQWEPAPVVVAEPEELWPRTLQYQTAVNPVSGNPVVFWADPYAMGLMAIEEDGNAKRLPLDISGGSYIGEPLVDGEYILLPVVTGEVACLARYHNGEFTYQIGPLVEQTGESVAAAIDILGSPAMIIVSDEMIGPDELVMFSIYGSSATLDTDVTTDCRVDAVASADGNLLHVVYSDAGTTWCRTVDYEGGTLDTELAFDKHSELIDVEINPLTGRPVCAYLFADTVYYNEQASDGTWPAPARITGAGADRQSFDVETTAEGVFIAMGQVGGPQTLYFINAGVWEVRASVDHDGLFSGTGLSLSVLPGGDFFVADIGDDGTSYLTTIQAGGGYTSEEFLRKTDILGLDLQAATSTTDLHVVTLKGAGVGHFRCDLTDYTWSEDIGIAGRYQVDLMSDLGGRIYLTSVSPGTAGVHQWDGGWLNIASVPISMDNRPLATGQPLFDKVFMLAPEPTAVTPEIHRVSIDAGVVSSSTGDLGTQPVWSGKISASSHGYKPFCVSGGGYFEAASFGFMNYSFELERLYGVPANVHADSGLIRGKLISTSYYEPLGYTDDAKVFWTAYGPTGSARVAYNVSGFYETTPIDTIPPFDFYDFDHETRMTTSAALGLSCTAIGLISNLDGTDTWFEWDDFGNWEQLELPAGIQHMSLPEIVVDYTGRWHLIYRHLYTGEILCWSTME